MANQIERSLAEAAGHLARRMAFWADHKLDVNPIVEHIENGIGDCELSSDSIDIKLSGGMAVLIGVVSYLEDLGYEVYAPLPEATSSYWSSRAHHESRTPLWIWWSNTECRRVQVGTKMEEVPIYELRCGPEESSDE